MPAKPKHCSVCGDPTRSLVALCRVHKHPVPTETQAWCAKGGHWVDFDGFAKGQMTCRDCRREHYNRRCNMSKGKTCKVCGVPVANTNVAGRCMDCHKAHIQEMRVFTPSRRYVNHDGYVVLTSQWDSPNHTRRGHILEHVKVMADALGRPLIPGENVHHINGVRDDNRPENLELWSTSQPSGQRVEDKIVWAKELLALYQPDALASDLSTRIKKENGHV